MARGNGAGACATAGARGRAVAAEEQPLVVNGIVDQAALTACLEALPNHGRVAGLGPLVELNKFNGRYSVSPRSGSRLESQQHHDAASAAAYIAEVIAAGRPKRFSWKEMPPPAHTADETNDAYEKRLRQWAQLAYPQKLWLRFGHKTAAPLAEAAAHQLHELSSRMPWIVKGLKSVAVSEASYYQRRYSQLDGCTWGQYNRGQITLNPVWWENERRFRVELARSVQTKYHPPGCGTPESVITHEIGHLVDDMLGRDPKHETSWRAFKADAKERGLTLPSTYAHHDENKHDMEAVAESFAEIIHSPQELSPYATALKAWLDERKLLAPAPRTCRKGRRRTTRPLRSQAWVNGSTRFARAATVRPRSATSSKTTRCAMQSVA